MSETANWTRAERLQHIKRKYSPTNPTAYAYPKDVAWHAMYEDIPWLVRQIEELGVGTDASGERAGG